MKKELLLKIVFPNFLVSLVIILACIFWGFTSHIIAKNLIETTEVECPVIREGDDFIADCNGLKKTLVRDTGSLLAYINSKKVKCFIPANNKLWCNS